MSDLYKEYCYTMDYKFYHNDGKTFTPITRKEYKEKTGESDYIIEKLRNSLYVSQHTDYFFLKVPPKAKDKRIYAPIDWKLINLVKYFMNHNFKTVNSDQGDFYSIGDIYFKPNARLIPFLIEIFGKENIIQLEKTFDFNLIKFKTTNWYKYPEWNNKLIIMKDTTINREGETIHNTVLYFHKKMIKFMYRKLNLTYPDRTKAHTGRRMINNYFKEKFNL